MVSALLLTPVLATADDYDQVRERLSSLVNGETNISIAESPLPGILQVRLGSDIVYMTDDGRYLLQGRVLDLDTREDITDRAKSKIRQELIDGIDYEKLISYGPEDSEFEIIVFTDVDCVTAGGCISRSRSTTMQVSGSATRHFRAPVSVRKPFAR